MLPVAVAQSSFDDNEICYVLPDLWMMLCFHVIEGTGRIKDDARVSSSLPGGSTSRTLDNVVWSRSLGKVK